MMFRIWKSSEAWHLVDTHQTLTPFVYDDIDELLNDLKFLMEGYNFNAKFV